MPPDSRNNWSLRLGAESAAIVFSILLAFAIDAWWDMRQQKEVVTTYLASLQTELQTNLGILDDHIKALETQRASIENYVLDVVLAKPGTVTQDQIQRMMWEFGPPLAFPARRAAFDDLVSGGLRLVDNPEIRRLVLEYGQAMELDAIRQERAEIWFDDRMERYNEMHADLVGMRTVGEGGWPGGKTPKLEFDPESFVGNRQFANLLMARFFRIENIIQSRSRLRDTLVELLRDVGANDR